ncbi:hypothetical protein JXA84_03470 [candidate division WOR-3 bacterium]|nr:hypothetical protein [candidate division WOR-3 bacterium]
MQVFSVFCVLQVVFFNFIEPSRIQKGDSLYLALGPEAALEYFKNLAVATDDTAFNDVMRRREYFDKLSGLGIWRDSIYFLDVEYDDETCERFLSHDIPNEVKALLWAKKATYMFEEGIISQSSDYYLRSGGSVNMLKAAKMLFETHSGTAKDILLEIVRQYPYTLEADLARIYLEELY